MMLCRAMCTIGALGTLSAPALAGKLTTIGVIPALVDGVNPESGLLPYKGKLYGTSSGGGLYNSGTLFALDPATGAETELYSFGSGNDGSEPHGNLLPLNGLLYGTTLYRGISSPGTIFAYDPATRKETNLYNFSGTVHDGPGTGLVLLGGKLYGTTIQGGTGSGTVFSFDPSNNTVKTIYTFQAGQDGATVYGPLTVLNNKLYGITTEAGANSHGTIFEIDPATGAETTLHAFGGSNDGYFANPGLLGDKGLLFGTTSRGNGNDGVVFSISPDGANYTILHQFQNGSTDCATPTSPLLQVNGQLYGQALFCAGSSAGLYRIDPASAVLTPFYSFGSGSAGGGLSNIGGVIFGAAAPAGAPGQSGVVFSYNLPTSTETTLRTFIDPNSFAGHSSALLQVGTMFFGTSATGGTFNRGSVFAVNAKTKSVTTLYAFTGGADGANPMADLTLANGKLIGTASAGGSGNGVVFSVDPSSGSETVLHTFSGADGAGPQSTLLLQGTAIYGTTFSGGVNQSGTLFTIDDTTGAFAKLHDFGAANDLQYPVAGLLPSGTTLYGVAQGPNHTGGIFTYDTVTQVEKVAHTFGSYHDGAEPGASLIDVGGTFYGTTRYNGALGYGTIYSFNPGSGAEAVVHSFPRMANDEPAAPLLPVGTKLIGAAESIESNPYFGSVFSFTPATGAFGQLYAFTNKSDGARPSSGLVYYNGHVWGTTSNSDPNAGGAAGTVFETFP